MSVSVTMPALGESVTEGTVTRWLKAVGDTITADEPLLGLGTGHRIERHRRVRPTGQHRRAGERLRPRVGLRLKIEGVPVLVDEHAGGGLTAV